MMEVLRQRDRISNNYEIRIRTPQYLPEHERAKVSLLLNKESKKNKISKLMNAMNDPLFLRDLNDISMDYKEIGKEGCL